MEYNIRLKNGVVLRGMIASPGDNIRAIVILIHGIGEHIKRYNHVSDMFNRSGIGFTGVDLPGHGNSDGARGGIKSFSITDEVIKTVLEETRKTFPGIPLFIYGHSLGGIIVLDYLVRKNPDIRGAIVTAPWIKLGYEPSKFKLILAAIFKLLYPGFVQPSGLIASDLSQDADEVAKYVNDPLVHDKVSAGLFYSAVKAAANVLDNAASLRTPLLLMHGSMDRICSPAGSIEFAEKSPLTELKIWDGGYHEIHNEPFREEVFKYMTDWIDRRLAK